MKPLTKAQIIKAVKQAAADHSALMTRDEKFQAFCKVCDNMYKAGRISYKQHDEWTEIF
ncbi:hypothetical protein SCREM2_gp81 [Synechococcus phage S-CREM2]|nr:hypothetical protein SCREM2_gp81 [Synechococcus phage S-CREM2]